MSLWALDFYDSVIPMVPFICCSKIIPFIVFGSKKADNNHCLIYQFLQLSIYFALPLKIKIF